MGLIAAAADWRAGTTTTSAMSVHSALHWEWWPESAGARITLPIDIWLKVVPAVLGCQLFCCLFAIHHQQHSVQSNRSISQLVPSDAAAGGGGSSTTTASKLDTDDAFDVFDDVRADSSMTTTVLIAAQCRLRRWWPIAMLVMLINWAALIFPSFMILGDTAAGLVVVVVINFEIDENWCCCCCYCCCPLAHCR